MPVMPVPQMPAYPMVPYMRPPRNPKWLAAASGGTMSMVGGIFALIFGSITLAMDAFDSWDEGGLAIDPGAFISGIAFLGAFVMCSVSTYFTFRLLRFELAILGPIALIIAYLSVAFYTSFLFMLASEVFVLGLISIVLLMVAKSVFGGVQPSDAVAQYPGPALPPGT
jgi:hypothetical protein